MPTTCPTCHHSTVACVCGRSYADRIRGFQVHGSVRATASKRRYYDDDALSEQIGTKASERRERYWDDSQGLGAIKTDKDGRPWHKDRKTGEVQPVDSKALDRFIGPAGDKSSA